MRILFDEGVPIQLRRALPNHRVVTVQELGWHSILNGKLLARAEDEFDVFITADQNLKYQQNLQGRKIAILELSSNRRKVVEKNFEAIVQAVERISKGDFISLSLSY